MEAEYLFAEETYGEDSLKSQYLIAPGRRELRKERLYENSSLTSINKFIKDAFLPQGYPNSVSSDYLEYQIWDTCQAFCSSIVAALAAQAMLKAYGVGNETATILAATFTWLLKDGAGMVGRIVFTWLKGTELDCHAKKWRLAADVINDLTYCIELLAPRFRDYFLFFACMSSICRSLVGVCGGATRAALTQHQARRDNMADVSAKDGSQETMVNLLAFLVNLVLVPLVTGQEWIIWSLFLVFTTLHLYCNYRAVSAVVMETVNSTRMHLLVNYFINHGLALNPHAISAIEPILTTYIHYGQMSKLVKSECFCYAAYVNVKDSQYAGHSMFLNSYCNVQSIPIPHKIRGMMLFVLTHQILGYPNCLDVNLGCPLSKVFSSYDDFNAALRNSKGTHYVMKLEISNNFKSGCVNVALHRNIDSKSLLQCYFQIAIIDLVVRSPQLRTKGATQDEMSELALNNLCNLWQQIFNAKELPTTASWDLVSYAHNFTLQVFPAFLKELESRGWVISRTHLGPDEWRANWDLVRLNSETLSTNKQL